MSLTTLPEGLDAAGMGSVFIAPALADSSKPKLSEYASPTGFNISCDIFNWNPVPERSTIQQSRYCLAQSIEVAGRKTVSVDPVTIVYNPQDPDSENYVAYKEMKEGTQWFAFDRRGLPSKKELAVGEVGDIIPIEVILVRREAITDAEGESLRSTLVFRVFDEMKTDVEIVS